MFNIYISVEYINKIIFSLGLYVELILFNICVAITFCTGLSTLLLNGFIDDDLCGRDV